MALPQAKQDATEARLAGLTLPQGGWTDAARKAALARLTAMGLPGNRDEYWRFTRPTDLNAADAPASAPMDESDEAPIFDGIAVVNLVFRDGVFDADASDSDMPDGVTVERLSEAQASDIHWASGLYGTLEAEEQDPVQRPFAALNTAFATEGVLLHVTGKVTTPICLRYVHEGETSDPILHHVVKLDAGTELTLLEAGAPGARFNTSMEVDVADEARFHHVRAQGRNRDRRANTHSFARLGRESVFKSFTLSLNGALTRNEHVFVFNGDDASGHVAGAAIGDGKVAPFHHDDTVFVTHDALNCESRQVFKKVLKNGAVGVFQGKILVKKDAQKTDGYQISQALLLDDDSQFLAKPELEIYADDVACSHGSTTGSIDEDMLFYLRARGVPHARAMDLLVLAFLAEAMQEIEAEGIAESLTTRLSNWLERHAG
ncbi:FeS cluster assembly protein SufD [Rhodobacteraceae bacterium THAF1]|uniref:SufB/SufD family protein n=1 Tax=Palleronia sp. THAF1 TaxID=2587842 RepID=UPI000F4039CF|nr:SufD family Fe-S cluster assembly protein [Palleronia sp. THAF1]QFU08535.1 FeS cluster assembly protein SufD [Palleronia sp. THAF1]VDC30585.1 FeS cluster assembly protein SufD [Rhodobacteraceae bacterium THAF1]